MKKRYRWLIGGGFVAVLAAIVIVRLVTSGQSETKRLVTAVPVEVAKARAATLPVYLHALGTVVAYRTVTVEPMVTGPLEKVFFHEGQYVRKGQLLAEIDPQPFEAALQQAEAKLAQDRATRTSDALQAKQNATLVKKGYVSKQAYVAAWTAWLSAKALVQQDKASIRTSQISLAYTRILAPISGRTGILQVDPGNVVNPSLPNGIVTINMLQPIYVQFSLPQQDLPEINSAMAAGPVPLIAALKGKSASGRTFNQGVLTVLDNQVNASTGTLTLRGRFPNPLLDLWPGSFVNVRVWVRTLSHVVVVPSMAVQEGPSGRFVYLVEGGTKTPGGLKVVVRPVTVTYESKSLAVIGSGLTIGNTVVTEGSSRVRTDVPIKIVGQMKVTP
ncbi:MAG: efflux RND transporter periplasmic adaptor subunit [Gammaproteobacteria bacterium]